MKKKLKIICLILARAGSQRIPDKNIKLLGKKPLIAYTIECAKNSKYINRIIVSTDGQKIAAISVKYGAEVPFRRPSGISKADSTELDAFRHAFGWLKKNEGYVPDLIVKLFPTSPFRQTKSVDEAIELLISHPEADSVRSVRLCSEHPYMMWKIKGLRLKHFVPEAKKPKQAHTLSYQVLPKIYIQNAAIDVTRPANIWKKNSITGKKILAYVMDERESFDINTPLDFAFAQLMRKHRI